MSDCPPYKFNTSLGEPPATPTGLITTLRKGATTFGHAHFSTAFADTTLAVTQDTGGNYLVNTSSATRFGSWIVDTKHHGRLPVVASAVFDEVKEQGLLVRMTGTFTSADKPTTDAIWRARSESARSVFVARAALSGPLKPMQVRAVAASGAFAFSDTPPTFLVLLFCPGTVEFIFMGGEDRCHTKLTYTRSSDILWTTEGYHA